MKYWNAAFVRHVVSCETFGPCGWIDLIAYASRIVIIDKSGVQEW